MENDADAFGLHLIAQFSLCQAEYGGKVSR